MSVIVLEKRWRHHTKSGGYDNLGKFLNAHQVQRAHLRSLPSKILAKAWEYLYCDEVRLVGLFGALGLGSWNDIRARKWGLDLLMRPWHWPMYLSLNSVSLDHRKIIVGV
jgi:hypothetical protein